MLKALTGLVAALSLGATGGQANDKGKPVIISGDALEIIMIGSTHYLNLGGEKDAAVYYETVKTAHISIPDGPTWSGVLTVKKKGYHVAWTGGPEAEWTLQYAPGEILYLKPDGSVGGTVTKIVPGNPEGF